MHFSVENACQNLCHTVPPPPGCDEAAWPDKDHGLVCGECKVLVNRFNSFYGSCDGYCSSIGRVCTGAWEEDGDKCTVKYGMECNQEASSSDAICECGEAGTTVNATSAQTGPSTAIVTTVLLKFIHSGFEDVIFHYLRTCVVS